MNGRIYVVGNIATGGTLQVNGVTQLLSDLNVTGNIATVNGNISTTNGNLYIGGKSILVGDVAVVNGNVNIQNGNINMTNAASFINQFVLA
jgi:formylmethanofuran dehydrogenase subunit C